MVIPFDSPSAPGMVILAMELLPDEASSAGLRSQEEYYYEPVPTESDDDMEIDNISDLDPNDPFAIRHFRTRTGPTEMPSPEEVIGDEEYDADDEASQPSLENMDVDVDSAEGVATIAEKEEDGDHYRRTLEFGQYLTAYSSLDPEAGSDANHSAQAQYGSSPEPSSSASYDSNFSISPRWTGRDLSADLQDSDEEISNVARSLTLTQDPSPARGTREYFDRFTEARHYPDAAQFFAVEFSTGFFTNPFTIPLSPRPKSQPSPLTRTNDYGLIENWAFNPQNGPVSPVSPLSKYSQSKGGGSPVSPISADSRLYKRRGAVALGISTVSEFFEPVPGPSLRMSSSSSSGSSRILSTTSELTALLNELLFDNAAYEFFSRINVNALVSEQRSSAYTLEDHDSLHDSWNLDREWPFEKWLPHAPRRRCHCRWCIDFWTLNNEEEIYHPHDFDRRCSCPVCKRFEYQEEARDMQRAAEKQRSRDRELDQMRRRKRKRQQFESQHREMLVFDEQDARHRLSREIRMLNVVQEANEAEPLTTNESMRTFRADDVNIFSDLQSSQGQETNNVDETKAGDEHGNISKKQDLGMNDWIREHLREPETD